PKAHGGSDADSNLQSLCWPCHKAKTARERIN
ncbi:HNH endonuclease, partial [Escherichia coli]